MNVIDDEIVRILHDGGVQHDDVVVDRFAIILKSGRCVELTERGPSATNIADLKPNVNFDRYIGLRITGVVFSEDWATCGVRLSNGTALVMGSPFPYYWGMQEA